MFTGIAKPVRVSQALADPLAVDLGHDVHNRAGVAQRVRDDVPAEAAVDEELRRGG